MIIGFYAHFFQGLNRHDLFFFRGKEVIDFFAELICKLLNPFFLFFHHVFCDQPSAFCLRTSSLFLRRISRMTILASSAFCLPCLTICLRIASSIGGTLMRITWPSTTAADSNSPFRCLWRSRRRFGIERSDEKLRVREL